MGPNDQGLYAIGTNTYYINILPVTDKCVGEKITITATTNLGVGEQVLVEVYSSSFKPTQKTQSGEFSGATKIVTVETDDNNINYIRFDLDLSSFEQGEYIISVSSISNSDISNKIYFNIIDCSRHWHWNIPDFSHIFNWKYCPTCPVTTSQNWSIITVKPVTKK